MIESYLGDKEGEGRVSGTMGDIEAEMGGGGDDVPLR